MSQKCKKVRFLKAYRIDDKEKLQYYDCVSYIQLICSVMPVGLWAVTGAMI